MPQTPPKVFISYSHDSAAHKRWVAWFAETLCTNGIDTTLDQWDLTAGGDVPAFMEKQLKESDFILLICTENYVTKANEGLGGVGYEKMIVTSELISNINQKKFIPIVRQQSATNVPTFISSKLYVDFSDDEHIENSLSELLQAIHHDKVERKPHIGSFAGISNIKIPHQNSNSSVPVKTQNNLTNEEMKIFSYIVVRYDQHRENYWDEGKALQASGTGKIRAEVAIKSLIQKDLLTYGYNNNLLLTDNGKAYAIEHSII
ncbi:toll/interleukin-1 receptor domain-containing protein [Terasakiella sp. SH-1]|uniref:toll/interleukin-1 receptor domain-containing protein n=1 Tax=Terasakiella sp. SH-1 TaxID=2560057 RepID=UPI0010747CFD|nr:toll/interleukin-1 receptor domain-containing protein [Terasakiella sp. SH-1]